MTVALKISRALEYFSEKELSMQLGAPLEEWGITLVKELVDNALDACEREDTTPDIAITVSGNSITITDNGPGIPADTVEKSLDYLHRVSDKALRVTPTRGQLGNALKGVYAAPFVLDGVSNVTIEAQGIRHEITVRLDHIAQQPDIHHTPQRCDRQDGTSVRIVSSQLACQLRGEDDDSYQIGLRELADRFVLFNPSASITVTVDGEVDTVARNTKDFAKWHIGKPSSAHWYSPETLRDLIAGFIANGRGSMTVRDFLAEFHGLKGTKARGDILAETGLARATLNDLTDGNDISFDQVADLIGAMKERSREVQPKALGVLGEENMTASLEVDYRAKAVRYARQMGTTASGLPFVVEVAVGILDGYECQSTIVGLNNTPLFRDPIFWLPNLLSDCRVDAYDPVVIAVHIACPRFEFTEHGKNTVMLPAEIKDALIAVLKKGTKHWSKAKQQVDRQGRVLQRELERIRKEGRKEKLSIKEACYQCFEQAYNHASSDGLLPANARQVMYAIRPLVLALTGGEFYRQSASFTQGILPDFVNEHPELTTKWDIVFDARGKLVEPHTGRRVDLGTLAVREYRDEWKEELDTEVDISIATALATVGPNFRFNNALFLEKEGFDPHLKAAQIAERFDIAIFSTKGMSVTAARQLVEWLTERDVRIFVARDLDKPGFSILETLRSDTRRHKFRTKPNIIDLGLRLKDAKAMGLLSEPVSYNSNVSPAERLRQCGATQDEINLLVSGGQAKGWTGERTELNAMTSRQFIDWLEGGLTKHGVKKLIPDDDALNDGYRRAAKLQKIQAAIDAAIEEDQQAEIEPPSNLRDQLSEMLEENPEMPWDAAVAEIALEDSE